MNWYFLNLKWAFLCLACVSLSSCAGKTPGEHLADMPHWMGGEPAGVPPRRGTPEYDAWMAARPGSGEVEGRAAAEDRSA